MLCIRVQWNLGIADMLNNGHLPIADTLSQSNADTLSQSRRCPLFRGFTVLYWEKFLRGENFADFGLIREFLHGKFAFTAKKWASFVARRGMKNTNPFPFYLRLIFLLWKSENEAPRNVCFWPFHEVKSPRKIWKGLIRENKSPRNKKTFVPAKMSPDKVPTNQ